MGFLKQAAAQPLGSHDIGEMHLFITAISPFAFGGINLPIYKAGTPLLLTIARRVCTK